MTTGNLPTFASVTSGRFSVFSPMLPKRARVQGGREIAPREGRTMNDRDQRQYGRLMLINPERVFYAGLLCKPRKRSSGGYNIYIAMDGRLTVTETRSESVGEVAMVAPYTPHSVDSEHRCIICLVIEPETVEQAAMQRLAEKIRAPAASPFARRVRAAYENLRSQQ